MAEKHHNVYVVELDQALWSDDNFVAANPGCPPGAPCLYVGMTGLTPEERFQRHKDGIQASRRVRRYGLRLVPEIYERLNPMTYEEAVAAEIGLAAGLRAAGYAVWQK